MARRIERAMELSVELRERLPRSGRANVFPASDSGVVLWQPVAGQTRDDVLARLPGGLASKTAVNCEERLRRVAAALNMDLDIVWPAIGDAPSLPI